MTTFTITRGSETITIDPSFAYHWLPSDTLPDLRLFCETLSPGVYRVEMEVSNCSLVIGDKSETKPTVHAPIRISTDDGTMIYGDTAFPSVYPMGRGTWRRFMLGRDVPPSFVSNWASARLKYGPCGLPLPTLGAQQAATQQAADSSSLVNVQMALGLQRPFTIEDSRDGVFSSINGWSPWGPPDPAEVGGSGIYFTTGWHQNLADLRRAVLVARCEHERMKHWYRRHDGEPISTDDYPGQTPFVDDYTPPPEAQIQDPAGDFLPMPYDGAHLIRGFRRTLQVAEQCGSQMALFSLRALAALQRLKLSHRGPPTVPGWSPLNLRSLTDSANADPNNGIFGSGPGRQIAWSGYLNAASRKLSGPVGESDAWDIAFLTFIEKATPSAGPIQKVGSGSGWPTGPFACQTFEQWILCAATAGLAIQHGVPVPDFVNRCLLHILGPRTQVPILPYYGSNGPAHYLQTADATGKAVPQLTTALPNASGDTLGDPAHVEVALALAAALNPTDAQGWIDRWALYNGNMSVAQKLAFYTSPQAGDISWQAFTLGVAQSLT